MRTLRSSVDFGFKGPFKPGQKRLDVGCFNRATAPDPQARGCITISADVVSDILGLKALGDCLGKSRTVTDARIGELEANRRVGARGRVCREVFDPVVCSAKIKDRLRIGIRPRDEPLEATVRARPRERPQLSFNRQHGRCVDRLAAEDTVNQLATLGKAEDLGQRPRGRVAFQPLDSAG